MQTKTHTHTQTTYTHRAKKEEHALLPESRHLHTNIYSGSGHTKLMVTSYQMLGLLDKDMSLLITCFQNFLWDNKTIYLPKVSFTAINND